MLKKADSGGLREFMNRNSALVTVGAVVLLMISLGLAFLQINGGGTPRITEAYYYNMNTGELFEEGIQKIGAISPPDGGTYDKYPWGSGPAGVKAYVFSCEDCSDEVSRFIGYLETIPPELAAKVKQASENPDASMDIMLAMETQTLVMSPDDPKKRWVPQASQPGQTIISRINGRCQGDQKLQFCYPD